MDQIAPSPLSPATPAHLGRTLAHGLSVLLRSEDIRRDDLLGIVDFALAHSGYDRAARVEIAQAFAAAVRSVPQTDTRLLEVAALWLAGEISDDARQAVVEVMTCLGLGIAETAHGRDELRRIVGDIRRDAPSLADAVAALVPVIQ